MMHCRDVTRLIAREELGRAGLLRRAAVRFHLLMCRHCGAYAAQLRAIGRAARERWGGRPEAEDRLAIERLRQAIGSGRAGNGRGDAPS
jgi:hypothetical protein